jgi:UDP-glucuronate 4-epimerase
MRILVTGCAGFIGSHLTESLLGDGHAVVGVDCFNDNYARPEKLRNLQLARDWDAFDFVPIDLSRGDLHDIVEECEVCFHLAAEPGVRASWGTRFDHYLRNNVLTTQHLLEAAKSLPERRFVYASSSSIYGHAADLPTPEDALPRPFSPYGATKLAGEHLCGLYQSNYGVQTVVLRYFSVYGPRQRPDMAFTIFGKALRDGLPVRLHGDGSQTRDFTYVGDVVLATRRAAIAKDAAGGVFNIGGGSQISLSDALSTLERIAGRRAAVEHVPVQKGDVRDTRASTERARIALDFSPKVGLEQGLDLQYQWLREAEASRSAFSV